MIKKIYISILVLLSLGGLIFLIQLNLKSKAVTKIKWSDFSTNEEIAIAINMRLRQEIKDHSIIFLGVEPGSKDHITIWKKWVSLNTELGWKIDEVLIEPELPMRQELWPEAKSFDILKNELDFINFIRDQSKLNRRIVIIVPHIYSSQLIMDNPIKRIIKESQQKILSITLVTIDKTSLPCVADGVDYTGQSGLGCIVKQKLFFYKNRKTKEHFLWSGMLEQFGFSDFLMFMKNP